MAHDLVGHLGLVGLFLTAFLAASLVPFPVEAVVPVMVAQGYEPVAVVVAGTAGGYAGSLLTYHLAARGEAWWRARHPRRARRLAPVQRAFARWGSPLLVLSWLPVVGEAVTVAGGFAGVRLRVFSCWTILGRALRMIALVQLSVAML